MLCSASPSVAARAQDVPGQYAAAPLPPPQTRLQPFKTPSIAALTAELNQASALAQLGRSKEAQAALAKLQQQVSLEQDVDLYVRFHTLRGELMNAAGEVASSLKAFKTLFDQDLSRADPALLSRSKISYALVALDTGQLLTAIDKLEQVAQLSLELADYELALTAGSHLVTALIIELRYDHARFWLQRLQPLAQRVDQRTHHEHLALMQLELTLLTQPDVDVTQPLQDYVDDTGSTWKGYAYRLLADALAAKNLTRAALAAAQQAVALLAHRPREHLQAAMAESEICLQLGAPEAAFGALANNALLANASPINLASAYFLRMQALLAQDLTDAAQAEFALFNNALSQANAQRSKESAEFYAAKLKAEQQEIDLEQARHREIISADAAAASRARELEAQSERNTWIGVMLVMLFLTLLFSYVELNRRVEKRLRLAEHEKSAQLERLIADKTRELEENAEEQAFIAQALERKRHVESIGMLAGSVAHDFNNLLQVVASANEHLDINALTPKGKQELDKSTQSLSVARKIVAQLLQYSRQQELKVEEVQLTSYLDDHAALFRAAVSEKVELTIDDKHFNATLHIDQSALTTALLNVLQHATDAMPRGGTLRLSTHEFRIEPQDQTSWNGLDEGRYAAIRVHYHKQHRAERLPELTNNTRPSWNAVLSCVRQAAGDYKIEQTPGKGTTVTILLPAQFALSKNAGKALKPRPLQDLSGRSILLVEDNQMVANVLLAALSSTGAAMTHAEDAQTALDYLNSGMHLDYVLSDINMPGELDGAALAVWVQENRPEVHVLLMSGFAETHHLANNQPILIKPFTRDELLALIARIESEQPALETGV